MPLLADGGRIVNISSGLTRIVMANRAPYAIMKSAVETLTRYMAFELGGRGITVNCVAPGAIATDFSGGVVRDNPQVAQAVANMTALGRPGVPEDIGPMIASLLSDDHRWVNAQRIEVSGECASESRRSPGQRIAELVRFDCNGNGRSKTAAPVERERQRGDSPFVWSEKMRYSASRAANFASHCGWAGRAGAVTRLPSTCA